VLPLSAKPASASKQCQAERGAQGEDASIAASALTDWPEESTKLQQPAPQKLISYSDLLERLAPTVPSKAIDIAVDEDKDQYSPSILPRC
jgi:hypothetical protein